MAACTFFAMIVSECFFYFAVEVSGRTKVMGNRDRDVQFEKLTIYELFPEFFLRIRMKEVDPLEANSAGPKFESIPWAFVHAIARGVPIHELARGSPRCLSGLRHRSCLAKLPVPIVAVIDSGGKSLHAVVELRGDDPTEGKDLLSHLSTMGVDPTNHNPSR